MDAKKLYLDLLKATNKYKQEVHCQMIIEVMSNEGTMTAFCKKALISEGLFLKWRKQYKIFEDCYQIGKIISKANWEEDGAKNSKKQNFNLPYWKHLGAIRYGIGRDKIRLDVDPEANPYEQYKQLIAQAGQEEYSASEVKQLMESINVGTRAFESFELQNQVKDMQGDLDKMRQNDAYNSSATTNITKAD